MKVCGKCKIEKKDSDFGVDNRYGSLRAYCRECMVQYSRNYYYDVIKPKLPPKKLLPPCKEGFKFCIKCKTEKLNTDFYKFRSNVCKSCESLQQMERYWKNHDKIIARSAQYRKDNSDRIKKKAAEYREKINHTFYSGQKNKEYRENLTDSYIRQRIRATGIKNENIDEKMIEIWRGKILLERIKKLVEKTGMKICSVCRKTLPLSNFRIKKHIWKGVQKVGHDNLCKECSNKRIRRYQKKQKNEIQRSV